MDYKNEYPAMFISCILAGFLAGFIFDACRALRTGLKLKRVMPVIDIAFWVLVLCITYSVLFASGSGQLRGFCVAGIFGGAILYAMCFSKIICPWMVISVRAVSGVAKWITAPFCRIFGWFCTKFAGFVQIIQKNIKNFGKKTLENS